LKASLITFAVILIELTSIPVNCAKAYDLNSPVRGVPQNHEVANTFLAVTEDRLWAEQGDRFAQSSLGFCYISGCEGVGEDYTQAAYWLQKAADQCDEEAEAELGSLYYNGAGVKKDWETAKKWFQKVAEQDHWEAQLGMARIYIERHKDKKDDEEAYFWLLIAGRTEGRIEVREFADMVAMVTKLQERLLTQEQVSAVRRRVEEWKPVPCSSSSLPKKFECHSGEREINGHQVTVDCDGKSSIHEEWKKNGVDDREDGPAWILREPTTGSIMAEDWLRNGKRDRKDGPAYIVYDGLTGDATLEAWYKEGKNFEPSDEQRSAWTKEKLDRSMPPLKLKSGRD
jgi:hypothetical protein